MEQTFVDLGMSPLTQSFLPADKLDDMEPYFPLHVLMCTECMLVQLRDYVSPDSIFTEYAYFSSYSPSWVAHAKSYCEMITDRLRLGPESLVVEIACNDGYLLQHFLPMGLPVLGIEPALNVAAVARAKGIPVETEFFGRKLARRLVSAGKRADLIVGNNVLAHVPELNDFVAGMVALLAPDGVITMEFPHLERLMAENQFDTIYHEHFSYFSLIAVARLAASHRLKLIDVEQLPTHGGSLRIYMCNEASTAHRISPRVGALLEHEERLGFRDIAHYSRFEERVKATKRSILSFLIAAKEAGKKIVGYGAPGKGNTLLNYCGIGTDFLDFTVDRNTYKHGLYTPGMHIPVLPVEAIDAARPDLILILPWNLKAEIVAQMRHVASWGGKFVVPIPRIEVIDPASIA